MEYRLIIKKDNVVVNELTGSGLPASLELNAVLIWRLNDKKKTKIYSTFDSKTGLKVLKASCCFVGADANYKYEYIFTGYEVNNLPPII